MPQVPLSVREVFHVVRQSLDRVDSVIKDDKIPVLGLILLECESLQCIAIVIRKLSKKGAMYCHCGGLLNVTFHICFCRSGLRSKMHSCEMSCQCLGQ